MSIMLEVEQPGSITLALISGETASLMKLLAPSNNRNLQLKPVLLLIFKGVQIKANSKILTWHFTALAAIAH